MKNQSIQTIRRFNPALADGLRLLSGGLVPSDDRLQKPNMPSIMPAILVGLALCFGIVGPSQAAVVVAPPGATVAGRTIAEWSAAWWQWAAGLASPGDPFTDTTGAYANVNQSGPVFFLAGSPGGYNSRQFTVPADTYVLVPLLASEWSQLELGFDKTAAEIRQAAQNQANQINSLHATLDGTTISQATLFTHREVSPDFAFVAMANNQVVIFVAGNSGIAVADGYFLMIAPPTPGIHVLNYGGGASVPGIFIDETDTITVLGPPPTITSQPADQAVFIGSNATFSVSATTTNPPLHFQWQFNGTDLPGATNDTLTISNAQSANIGGYRAVISDSVGRANSRAARLTLIGLPPFISSQPAGLVIPATSNATFTVIAIGGEPLFYQWRFNQADMVGATNSTLVITNVQPGQMGEYAVVVTNNYGAVTSSIALLRLLAWIRTSNGLVNNAVAVDGSGNVVVTGYSYNGTNNDYGTAKYAATNGALLWEQRYNGPANTDDQATAAAVDGSGNVVVTGSSYNGAPNYDPDYYTAKYAAANGALLWEQRYNGPANRSDYANAVAVDGSGNVVVTGYSANGPPNYGDDYYTAKYAAANGALLWQKRYNGPADSFDEAQAVAVDGSGNVVVTGSSVGSFDSLGNPSADYYTAKYAAANGALLWQKRYNGPANNNDSAYAVAVDGSGNVVVTGTSQGDFYTAKYAAANGALLWEKRYNPANSNGRASAVAVDGSGNVVVTGYSNTNFNTDYYTAKYAAANGALLWEQRYNGPANGADDASAVGVDGSGNVVVTGSSQFDSYTTAYRAADGAVFWDYRHGGSGVSDVAVDAQGNVIVAGRTVTLRIQTALATIPIYRFTSIEFTNGQVQLDWTPAPGLVLQRTPSLTSPNWQTVAGSLNTNRITVPAADASGFFQLVKP